MKVDFLIEIFIPQSNPIVLANINIQHFYS